MNINNLNKVLEQYINNFDFLNDEDGNDEGYKWVAAYCFKQNWNINAEDFPNMFKNAMAKMSNLVDNSSVQPLGGLRMLLNHNDEVDFLRNAFRKLFADDNGDLVLRQRNIENFIDDVNERIHKYTPENSWKYNQTLNAVIYYLNLWKPSENYIYKYTECYDWANVVDYGDDFGSGSTFSLRKFYNMCDEMLKILKQNDRLIKLHKLRITSKGFDPAVGFDDELHILVYDVIYCAYQYLYYDRSEFGSITPSQRLKRLKQQDEINQLEKEIERIDKQIFDLSAVEIPSLIGVKVNHKKFGEGTIIRANTEVSIPTITIKFSVEEKTLALYTIIENGIITIDIQEVVDAVNKNINAVKEVSRLQALRNERVRKLEKIK